MTRSEIMPQIENLKKQLAGLYAAEKIMSTAMVIFQFGGVAAKLIFHPRRQANFPVWR
jgi:hypothetical protein